MILSTRHQIAFLCTPKTASTAIEEVLRPLGDVIISGPPGLKHITARDYHRFVSPLLRRKFPDTPIESFCLMREPLQWAHSWYRYRSRKALQNPGHEFHRNYTGHISFDRFIEAMLESTPPGFARIGSQASFICLANDQPGVDRIFDFADLRTVRAWLAQRLGRRVRLRKANVSPVAALELDPGLESAFRQAHARDYELYARLNPRP